MIEEGTVVARQAPFTNAAYRDLAIIAAVVFFTWLGIERTNTCDRFFAWVAANPDYEVDSVILAFILSALGTTVFAWRRFREMQLANSARDEAQRHLHSLAYHDPLTGLSNRRALNERLEALHLTATEHAALVFIDLDRFKAVNDLHGHMAGDRLLRIAAERVRIELGVDTPIYRIGGDKFAIVVKMEHAGDTAPQRVARRIVHVMANPFEDQGLVHHIGASAGIALFPNDGTTADALTRAADLALYRAKDAGRGQHRSYDAEMDAQIKQRAALEQEIRQGIAASEFVPYYQPLIDLKSGVTIGFELLTRWNRTDGTEIGPDRFIPIAEESGLIGELMLDLIEKVCTEARDWDPALTIAVNISPVQLKDPWLSQKVLGVMARHGFAPQRLAIEITENAIIADEENAKLTIESFKNQGMQIGLDDFGTGYSSLLYLQMFPFDKIKIDRSFVTSLDENPESIKIVKAIIGLALSLDMPVIAEGIETVEVAEMLCQLGCAQGQGFLFGRPLPGKIISCVLDDAPPQSWTNAEIERESVRPDLRRFA